MRKKRTDDFRSLSANPSAANAASLVYVVGSALYVSSKTTSTFAIYAASDVALANVCSVAPASVTGVNPALMHKSCLY